MQPAQKRRLHKALQLFRVDPFNDVLYNHALTGTWAGHRSVSFGGDWRLHYYEVEEGVAVFVACGTHSQLYK